MRRNVFAPRGMWGGIAIDWLASPLMLVFQNEFRIRSTAAFQRMALNGVRVEEALDQLGLHKSPSRVGLPPTAVVTS